MCSSGDYKRPVDFIPPAYSSAYGDEPKGCTCIALGYYQNFSTRTPDATSPTYSNDTISYGGNLENIGDMLSKGNVGRVLDSFQRLPRYFRP